MTEKMRCMSCGEPMLWADDPTVNKAIEQGRGVTLARCPHCGYEVTLEPGKPNSVLMAEGIDYD